jgi:hypothetical protein
MASFNLYVDELASLLRGTLDPQRVEAALDGAVSAELRARVSLDVRRKQGAFFTGQELAARLIDSEVAAKGPIADPALGGGDLLLAAANELPLAGSVGATLLRWGKRLYGTDLRREYVRATRIRIALLAAHRLDTRTYLDENRLAELLPNIRVGDGRRAVIPKRSLVVLNPPYGSTLAPTKLEWAQGSVSRAALFAANVIENTPAGASFAAILPDVLRSGTNYARWRAYIEKLMRVDSVEAVGQFDSWADIDVFILRGEVTAKGMGSVGAGAWNSPTSADTVDNYFDVNVGAVVPHRDPDKGRWFPYLTVHDLPLGEKLESVVLPKRRSHRRVFEPPFVVVRRTSRPDTQTRRAVGTIVTGAGPVAVENHLVVCTPKNGTLKACKELQAVLHSDATDDWLDDRIRCRHLTVTAVGGVPWQGRD